MGYELDFGADGNGRIGGHASPIHFLPAREFAVVVFGNIDADRAISIRRNRVQMPRPGELIRGPEDKNKKGEFSDFSLQALQGTHGGGV